MSAQSIFWGVTIGYFVLLVVISVWSGAKTRTVRDYLTASGSIGSVVGGASLAATQMSAGTFVGTLGIHYLTGASFGMVVLGLWGGWIVQVLFVAPKFARFGGKTVPEFIRARYNSRAASVISAVLIIVAYTVYLTAQYQAGGQIFHAILGLPFLHGVLITIGVTLLFVLIGGMRATAYTDYLHALLMAGCFVAAVPAVLLQLGPEAIGGIVHQVQPSMTGWFYSSNALLGLGLAFLFAQATTPYELARLYTMKNIRTVRRAVGWSFLFQAIVFLSVCVLGMATRAIFPSLPTPDIASTVLSADVLPPIIGALLIIAVLGAIASSVSGIMIVSASALTNDLLSEVWRLSDRAQLWLTRAAVLVLGVVPVFLALRQLALVQFVVALQASLVASFFFATVVIGLNWRRATAAGAIASMCAGFVVALAWYAAGKPAGLDPVLPGVSVSLAVFFVVSLRTPGPGEKALATFFPPPRPRVSPVPNER
ncbi:sodium:solute symporter family protein [Saccharopolyspora hirsuta]|uniref:sodium:solute symporter family protein n=1 Tax=Saccharopolyspora hirsuta TaxID=1837 RepID=UPI0033314AF8